MIEASVFLGAAIIAVTDAIKDLSPKVRGYVTVCVAALLGLVVAVVDKEIGVADITIAQGIVLGLAAAGTVGVAKRVG